jgi:hypothetical protein
METNHGASTAVWYRRTSDHDQANGINSDINPTDDGTPAIPCFHLCWPRAAIPNTTITAADFTNGSRVVDNVTGITCKKEAHEARHITAPDGHKYLITAVIMEFTIDGMAAGAEFAVGEILTNTTQTKKGKVWAFTDNLDTTGTIQAVVGSASAWVNNDNITSSGGGDAELSANATAVGFLLDREYAGSTVTGTNGKFQIEADEWYSQRPQAGIDAGWDADAHDLPVIDFNSEAYQLIVDGDVAFVFGGFFFRDSADTNGLFYAGSSINAVLLVVGCLFRQSSSNTRMIYFYNQNARLDRFTIEGSGAGSSQDGLFTNVNYELIAKNGSICNCGNYGIKTDSARDIILSNVDIGVAMSTGSSDIFMQRGCGVFGVDVALGGTNGYVGTAVAFGPARAQFENWGKVLGRHKTIFVGGEWESVAVTATNANKKLSDTVMQITPNGNYVPIIEDWKTTNFVGEFELESGSQTLKFWIYNDTGSVINDATATQNLYLKATYVDSYDDTSEYTRVEAYSTEIDIADAADGDDWDYLSVAVNPATASKVRVELVISYYDATGVILIDPFPVVS